MPRGGAAASVGFGPGGDGEIPARPADPAHQPGRAAAKAERRGRSLHHRPARRKGEAHHRRLRRRGRPGPPGGLRPGAGARRQDVRQLRLLPVQPAHRRLRRQPGKPPALCPGGSGGGAGQPAGPAHRLQAGGAAGKLRPGGPSARRAGGGRADAGGRGRDQLSCDAGEPQRPDGHHPSGEPPGLWGGRLLFVPVRHGAAVHPPAGVRRGRADRPGLRGAAAGRRPHRLRRHEPPAHRRPRLAQQGARRPCRRGAPLRAVQQGLPGRPDGAQGRSLHF